MYYRLSFRSPRRLQQLRRPYCGLKEDTVLLFRGIPRTHPGYSNALKGLVIPPNNLSKPLDALSKIDAAASHNENQSSESCAAAGVEKGIWTSWTHSKKVAKLHAGKDGIVLSAHLGPSCGVKFMWSPDEYMEQEVLVQGIVRNGKIEDISEDDSKS